ncbi:MAG: glycosyltransferase family 4 protein [Vulcanimicrobiota bacterium]
MKNLLLLLDLLATLAALPLVGLVLLVNRLTCPRKDAPGRRILVFDMAYTLEIIQRRKLEVFVTCHDLGGFFEKVWFCHPVATVITPDNPEDAFGGPTVTPLSDRHVVIEGKLGLLRVLAGFQLFNFLLSQTALLARLDRVIRCEGISVIRSGDPYFLSFLGLILARTNGIPVALRLGAHYDRVREMTGRPVQPRLFPSIELEQWVQRQTIPRVDLVAGATQDYLDFAIQNGADPRRTVVFPYGIAIHPMHYSPPDARPAPDLGEFATLRGRFVVAVGRLTPVKKSSDLVEVMGRLRQWGVDCSLLIVGDGELREQMQARAEELDVDELVLFAGNRSQEWLAEVLPGASAMLSPLAGRALTETALAGVPVVAYDVDWHSDVIITGMTGELVPVDDIEAMAEGARKLLEDQDYARTCGRRLREKMLDHMDLEKLVATEREAYGRLL